MHASGRGHVSGERTYGYGWWPCRAGRTRSVHRGTHRRSESHGRGSTDGGDLGTRWCNTGSCGTLAGSWRGTPSRQRIARMHTGVLCRMPGVQPRVRTRQREQRRRGTTSPAGGAACSPLYRVTLRPDDLFLYLRWRATAYCVRHGVCHRECWYTRTDSSVQTVDGATPYYSTDEGPYQLVSGRVRTAVQQRVRSVSSVYARYTRQPVPNGSGRSPAHYHGAEATPTLPGCNHATAATRDRHGRGCCLGHGVFPRAEATARWRTNTPLQLSSCTQGTVRCGTQQIGRAHV